MQRRLYAMASGEYCDMTNVLTKIDPQPPRGIKYMLGDESWLPMDRRSPRRLHCEEWGNLGPMELDPSIKPNAAGFRVRSTEFIAPPGARGFTNIQGVYYWTDTDCWQQMDEYEYQNFGGVDRTAGQH